MKERNISIDILKCIAAILITNSHMDSLYGQYSILATGGAIGDVLFFFCSGFTLFWAGWGVSTIGIKDESTEFTLLYLHGLY